MDKRYGNAIRFCAVSLGYPGRTVIKDFDATVPRSGMTTLLGQNGCGKTTVLRSLIKHAVLINGAIYMNGRDMKHMEVETLPQYVSYAPALATAAPNMLAAVSTPVPCAPPISHPILIRSLCSPNS